MIRRIPSSGILREELPVVNVYEDSDALVFIPLAELSAGHRAGHSQAPGAQPRST